MVQGFISLSHSFIFPLHESILNLTQATPENEIDKKCQDENCNSRKKAIAQVGEEKVEREREDERNLRYRAKLLA